MHLRKLSKLIALIYSNALKIISQLHFFKLSTEIREKMETSSTTEEPAPSESEPTTTMAQQAIQSAQSAAESALMYVRIAVIIH